MLFWVKLLSAHATVAIVRATTFDEKPVRASSVQPESLLQCARAVQPNPKRKWTRVWRSIWRYFFNR
jgi:hypothetical protein